MLDPGESESMVLAAAASLPVFIDEKKGRRIATDKGIPVIGLLGLLARAVQRGFMDSGKALSFPAVARSLGFRASDALVQELKAAIGV